jgi:two-component system, NarL family, response regulator NreC
MAGRFPDIEKFKEITIVLADDHQLVRQGLRGMLERQPDFRVVGEAGTGLEVFRVVERFRPNVVVLDMMMPQLNGLEVTRQLSKRSPKTRTVILSMHRDESYVVQALKNGATGYVLKDASVDELVKAIREAAAGRRYLSPPLSDSAVGAYMQQSNVASLDLYNSLSNREREVLHLAAEGHTNTEIGKRLFISPRTVEIHRANMMAKLGLRNHTELIRYALKHRLITND